MLIYFVSSKSSVELVAPVTQQSTYVKLVKHVHYAEVSF